nr:hypothetical protein Iba_chr02bCG15930 [Ipomoea batatas]
MAAKTLERINEANFQVALERSLVDTHHRLGEHPLNLANDFLDVIVESNNRDTVDMNIIHTSANIEENVVEEEGMNVEENISNEGLVEVDVGREIDLNQADEIEDENADKSAEKNIPHLEIAAAAHDSPLEAKLISEQHILSDHVMEDIDNYHDEHNVVEGEHDIIEASSSPNSDENL